MEKTFRYLIASLFMLLMPVVAWADDDDEEDEPFEIAYTGKYSLEFQMGTSKNLKSYGNLPDEGAAVLGAGVSQMTWGGRFTMFQNKHLGYFFEAYYSMLDGDNDQLYGKFRNHGIVDYDGSTSERYFDWRNDDVGSWTLMVGAMYRYDVSRWSFRPRFGIGWRSLKDVENGIEIYQENSLTETTEYLHSFSLENRSKCSAESYNAFVYSPGVQVCFTPRHHFYFHMDISWMGTLSKLYQVNSVQTIHSRETIDSAGKFYWAETTYPAERTRQHVSMGNYLSFRFGVGWNIGK